MTNFKLGKHIRPAVVTGVKNILVNNSDSGIFSGFVAVRMLDTNDSIDWVKWTNPLMGASGYGIATTPEIDDTVVVGFDLRLRAYVVGMLTYNQILKSILDQSQFPGEDKDVRLKLKSGELLIRGKTKSSILFRNDGTTIFMLDDTKDESDSSNLIIAFDKDQNVTIKNANNVDVTAKKIIGTADEVDVVSDNINLGKGLVKSPIVRNTDIVQSLDSFGIPIFSQQYITSSTSAKSS